MHAKIIALVPFWHLHFNRIKYYFHWRIVVLFFFFKMQQQEENNGWNVWNLRAQMVVVIVAMFWSIPLSIVHRNLPSLKLYDESIVDMHVCIFYTEYLTLWNLKYDTKQIWSSLRATSNQRINYKSSLFHMHFALSLSI